MARSGPETGPAKWLSWVPVLIVVVALSYAFFAGFSRAGSERGAVSAECPRAAKVTATSDVVLRWTPTASAASARTTVVATGVTPPEPPSALAVADPERGAQWLWWCWAGRLGSVESVTWADGAVTLVGAMDATQSFADDPKGSGHGFFRIVETPFPFRGGAVLRYWPVDGSEADSWSATVTVREEPTGDRFNTPVYWGGYPERTWTAEGARSSVWRLGSEGPQSVDVTFEPTFVSSLAAWLPRLVPKVGLAADTHDGSVDVSMQRVTTIVAPLMGAALVLGWVWRRSLVVSGLMVAGVFVLTSLYNLEFPLSAQGGAFLTGLGWTLFVLAAGLLVTVTVGSKPESRWSHVRTVLGGLGGFVLGAWVVWGLSWVVPGAIASWLIGLSAFVFMFAGVWAFYSVLYWMFVVLLGRFRTTLDMLLTALAIGSICFAAGLPLGKSFRSVSDSRRTWDESVRDFVWQFTRDAQWLSLGLGDSVWLALVAMAILGVRRSALRGSAVPLGLIAFVLALGGSLVTLSGGPLAIGALAWVPGFLVLWFGLDQCRRRSEARLAVSEDVDADDPAGLSAALRRAVELPLVATRLRLHYFWEGRAMARLALPLALLPTLATTLGVIGAIRHQTDSASAPVALVLSILVEAARWITLAFVFGALHRLLPGRYRPIKAAWLATLIIVANAVPQLGVLAAGGRFDGLLLYRALQVALYLVALAVLADHRIIRRHGGALADLPEVYGLTTSVRLALAITPIAALTSTLVYQIISGSPADAGRTLLEGFSALLLP